MTQEKINRINELARKSRTPEGLTDAEKTEQKKLRNEYRRSVINDLETKLSSIEFTDAPLSRKEKTE